MERSVVLTNARALTMDVPCPRAGAVIIEGDRIAWVGSASDARSVAGSNTEIVDCGGGTIMPGFHDAHVHLLAYAASLVELDCGPGVVSSIKDIQRVVADAVSNTPRGDWIRGVGYDDTALDERRHPTRWDLDEAAPDHPVRINHRSGHASVLNSAAMRRVGIGESSPEPPGATIARDLETGSPNGLLFEMDEYLDSRVTPLSRPDLESAIDKASNRLLSLGITSVQDATHSNSVARWRLFEDLRKSQPRLPRLTAMPGAHHVAEFADEGLKFGSGDEWLRVGHAKIMVTASSGRRTPDSAEFRTIVAECVDRGFPVAVHAVEADVVQNVANDLSASGSTGLGVPHRIEHCSETPPDTLGPVAECGAAVVTQPGFVYHSGDRYMKTIELTMLPFLYRARSLLDMGITVAFGSDAPVADPDPMPGVYSALTRRTASGATLGDGEGIDLYDALYASTTAPAQLAGIGDTVGKLAPGHLADIIVFDTDLESADPDKLASVRLVMTILGGRIVSGG